MEHGSGPALVLTEEEFEAWREHPATVIVLRYLTDVAGTIRMQWASGEDWTEEARLRVQAYEDLATLDHESIASFYDAMGKRLPAVRNGAAAVRHYEREQENDRDDHTA